MTFLFWERIRDWLILAALLLLTVVVMFNRNEPVVRSLRAMAIEATAPVEQQFAWAAGYFRALDENDQLRRENILLSSQVARLREAQIENDRLRGMLSFQDTAGYEMRAARIVSKDITRQENFFTINVGRAGGIEVDMPVVDERGILGKVVIVSDNYAVVQPYLNTNFRVPAKIQPIQADGIVRWEGARTDHLRMDHVPKTEPIVPGQLVVTSGYSGVFPPGLPIGRVDSVASFAGRNEFIIYLRPSAPLTRSEHVYVLLIRPDPERLAIEEQVL